MSKGLKWGLFFHGGILILGYNNSEVVVEDLWGILSAGKRYVNKSLDYY